MIVLEATDDTLSGRLRFAGTRVELASVISCILVGDTLEEIAEQYPTVPREFVFLVSEQLSWAGVKW